MAWVTGRSARHSENGKKFTNLYYNYSLYHNYFRCFITCTHPSISQTSWMPSFTSSCTNLFEECFRATNPPLQVKPPQLPPPPSGTPLKQPHPGWLLRCHWRWYMVLMVPLMHLQGGKKPMWVWVWVLTQMPLHRMPLHRITLLYRTTMRTELCFTCMSFLHKITPCDVQSPEVI